MEEKFIQKRLELSSDKSNDKIRIDNLCKLISNHTYKEEIYKEFEIDSIGQEYITIGNIIAVYNKIQSINNNYNRFNIYAHTKDVNIFQEEKVENGQIQKAVYFEFDEYVEIDEVKKNLKAIAIYNSKNKFFDEYDMAKFANSLLKKQNPVLSSLVSYNVNFFKELAQNQKEFNKYKSYRLVENKGDVYLRGITSENYKEYGVDFVFVISMLVLHKNMKNNLGLNYLIKDCSLNESKLEIIVNETHLKDAGSFGKVSTAIKISNNDLGDESLNFTNIINVGNLVDKGFPLFPRTKRLDRTKLSIIHTTGIEKVFIALRDMDEVLNTGEKFIKELKEVKSIKTPDELRVKILSKIVNSRSSFKGIKKLADIFKRKIDNEISNFEKLLEMCNKAEELDIQYDLKDRLRYIISDIILYGKTK